MLFGNIPYYISTQIFFKFLELEHFKEAYFTVQKEFFETVNASCNSKQYSSLSVLFQTFCEIKKLFVIGRLNFFPKPNVDSIFLSLKKKYQPSDQALKDYSVFVKSCFSRPRKVLLNNPIFEELEEEMKESLLENKLLTKNTRISELNPEEILILFKTLKELSIL
ncbi:16S ribosomal RNA methyltransferase KsgA/Dim1 family protein [Mycoplasma wenyonii str. Massachusetts]|uniref:16S ribosomal RNA methyltransferase KsgA/Dim1 family protein n=1 Tax=Mycoplasma wenyonii (strain Massachusetts) TaxID=1197325 RepID=I6YMB9_MYCWM|nr:16S ribosomal RNA methyltransferase KsgA/Dim1 family protein [Mycoplasma wenyonii str. Massachusetts]